MSAGNYKSLDAEKIVETAAKLQRRIAERFPDAGLAKLANELHGVAVQARERVAWIRRPLFKLRVLAIVVLIGIPLVLFVLESWAVDEGMRLRLGIRNLGEFLQTLEASLGTLVFLGAAAFFVFSIERRVKRERTLDAIHELRSMAHIVDMHQLTKDPERSLANYDSTASSPKSELTAFQLERYFDYCSEMLSLVSKVAALYVQGLPDPDAISAVDEIEALTAGLSRKVWQKIDLLDRYRAGQKPLDRPQANSGA